MTGAATNPIVAEAPVLSVAGLTTSFMLERRWVRVVRNVPFEVAARETVAIVGASPGRARA